MIPPNIYELCRNGKSVSGELAQNLNEAASAARERLFGGRLKTEVQKERSKSNATEKSENDLQQALDCGNWGETKPSELFLQIYHDVLCTLENNPLLGVTSPSLMGSHGVSPLAVIAPIPEICRHMSNVIARAEKEVFLATNYWMLSEPTKLICEGLRHLSKKAVEKGTTVVVKIMYDRGNPKQFIDNHLKVLPKEYADPKGKIGIPPPEELPNLELEVVNFHKPIFGTFHCKYVVVDRCIAIIQSNNIQDNDNLEMMVQLEGPIVNSFYDVACISWHNEMKPPLPLLTEPQRAEMYPTFSTKDHATLFNQNGDLEPAYQKDNPVPEGTETLPEIAAEGSKQDLPLHSSADPHFDSDLSGEVLRAISNLKPRSGETRLAPITRLLNTTIQPDTKASAPDLQSASETMTPVIPIAPHPPFPCAMVCREPHGAAGKSSVHVPQNLAWISSLRHARESVFIQTPDLNAEALLPEILAACRRGIQVTYYYCLGYNDAGELLPGQGGHNEMIANKLYTDLHTTNHAANLHVYAYVAKDQIRPIHNKHKQRSCHIKLMVVDGHVGIQGNGNQDTQSYYHSQEVNVMIDSTLVVGRWMEGIKQNQNTHLYGKCESEGELAGCWVDKETGEMADGAIGPDAGKFAWAKGVVGAVQRVRGVGGF